MRRARVIVVISRTESLVGYILPSTDYAIHSFPETSRYGKRVLFKQMSSFQ